MDQLIHSFSLAAENFLFRQECQKRGLGAASVGADIALNDDVFVLNIGKDIVPGL